MHVESSTSMIACSGKYDKIEELLFQCLYMVLKTQICKRWYSNITNNSELLISPFLSMLMYEFQVEILEFEVVTNLLKKNHSLSTEVAACGRRTTSSRRPGNH